MREFKLINEQNVVYNLRTIRSTTLLETMDGLGYSYSLGYNKVGRTFQLNNKEENQIQLIGTLHFIDYSKYLSFVDFAQRSKGIRLCYKPLDTAYYLDVDIVGITSVDATNPWVSAEISLNGKGLYYTEDNLRYIVETIENEARWPITFGESIYNDYSSQSTNLMNKGHEEGELIVEILGFAKNPILTLSVDGVELYRVRFNLTVQSGERLIYSAKDGDNFVHIEKADGTITNVVSSLTLENDNFFKIPVGSSSLSTSTDDGVMGTIIYRILTPYRAV